MRAEWLDLPVAREVIASVAEGLAARYRVEPDTARREVERIFSANRELEKALRGAACARDVERLRVFKEAEKALRKELYYDLRRYRGEKSALSDLAGRLRAANDPETRGQMVEAILAAHASTRERLLHRSRFIGILAAWSTSARTFLDVGCGVAPLLLAREAPWCRAAAYTALDRDAQAIDCVAAFAESHGLDWLKARTWTLNEDWPEEDARYDMAFLLKLVPVIHRQERDLLDVLGRVPAHRLIISGSREALAKRGSIERRERAVLRSFAERTGLTCIAEEETGDEILMLLERTPHSVVEM
ncbi:MAG: rRNA ((1405)-N(7))-methyltransferase [Candidatus Sumerlaeota bacterium]|nr:rRNA ((1405)-N(7))-methyltransferase [Candidatus Sumerlaeota bacterium]